MKLFKRGYALLLLLIIVALVGGITMAVWLLWPLFTEGANVLILFNNTDEMRGSGGFTTAYMTITRQSGEFVTHFGSSYEIDTPPDASGAVLVVPPPKPMHDYMGIDRWSFRDANWSPDYPTSAQAASRFYAEITGAQDPVYVITVNMSAASTLMQYLPAFWDMPCEARGNEFYDPCTSTRYPLTQSLRDGWNVSASGPEGDKSFLNDRLQDVIAMMRSLDIWQQARIIPAGWEMLARGDVLLYSRDNEKQAFFAARGWSGPFPLPTDHDVIFYSENNIGYNKTSSWLHRYFEYDVDFTVSPPVAKLVITYENGAPYPPYGEDPGCTAVDSASVQQLANPTYYDRMRGCARIYAQIFPPHGSKLIDYDVPETPSAHFLFGLRGPTGRIQAVREAEINGWGYVLTVPYAHGAYNTNSVQLTYTLPDRITAANYRLTLPVVADMQGTWKIQLHLPDGTIRSMDYDMLTRQFTNDHIGS